MYKIIKIYIQTLTSLVNDFKKKDFFSSGLLEIIIFYTNLSFYMHLQAKAQVSSLFNVAK